MHAEPAVAVDPHVIDALMRDLVGHDRAPSAFLVYLLLWRRSMGGETGVGISLQSLAHATGLSKSAVQSAVRRLRIRRLIAVEQAGPTLAPTYRVLTPWRG